MQDAISAPKQYQCRHIFTDGRRCSSPCLRHEEFCYYHHTTRKPVADPRQRRSRRSTFHLPLPEDRSAIQASIGQVLQRIAANDIDPRRAGLLLYGLQIASLNLPKPQPASHHRNQEDEVPETVEEITIDPELGTLAPRTEIAKEEQRKSTIGLLLERMMQNEQKEPATIPTIQATAPDPAIPRSCRHPERREGSRRPLRRHRRSSPSGSKQAIQLHPAIARSRRPPKDVISTGGGALAAVVEKPASLPQSSPADTALCTQPPRSQLNPHNLVS
jgi:hypothetical protein